MNNNIPNEYKPISPLGYVGYQLLFSIPFIGFIFLIVYAVGGTNNINVKNFARSYFVIMLIAFVFICILIFLFEVNPNTITNQYS